MKKFRWIALAMVVLMVLSMSSCMPGNGRASVDQPAGFFWGIWHGWIAPISLVASLFNSDLSVYEINNTGFWYDFGFYMAIVSGFGGLGLARGRKRRRNYEEE